MESYERENVTVCFVPLKWNVLGWFYIVDCRNTKCRSCTED